MASSSFLAMLLLSAAHTSPSFALDALAVRRPAASVLIGAKRKVASVSTPYMLTKELVFTKLAPSFGAVAANCMFLSCFSAILNVRKTQSLGDMNPVPLVAIIGNCAAWLGYSYVTKDKFVFAANFPGLLLGIFYTLTAVRFASEAGALTIERLLLAYAGVIGSAGFVAATGVLSSAQDVIGYVANALLLVYYSAPASVIGKVIGQRSAASLYAPLLLMNSFNGYMWTAYGLATGDAFVWMINGLGAVLSTLQLILKIIF